MKRSVIPLCLAVLAVAALGSLAVATGGADLATLFDAVQASAPQLTPGLLLAGATPGFVLERKNDGGGGGGGAPDFAQIKSLIERQGTAWEEFKKTNDERLAKLEKGLPTTDLEAKLAKLNEELTTVAADAKAAAAKANRLPMGSSNEALEKELKRFNAAVKAFSIERGRPTTELDAEGYAAYKAAVATYIRKGVENLSPDERKAINVGTDPQGGYLVGEDMDAQIDRVVRRFSAMRNRARVVTIGNASWKKLVKVTGTSGATRGGETTAPTEGTSPTWSEIELRPGTYLSDQRITSESLEDSVQDVEADLIEEMGIEFAEMEGQDFIDGSGINRPRGFQSYDMVANASYVWGKVGFIASGGAAGFAASNPSDALIDLQHALKRQYRVGATWLMNDATLGTIRKFKDGQGLYLWAPSQLMQGAVGQLLGHPVDTDDFMPDLGSNTFPVAFGDFNRGYTIVDRKGMTILRDPFTAVPYVKFVGRRRTGGGITNFEAIKCLKCST